ncbi:MAG TPA: NfeD family protein [Candidatus Acidoferrales bacterium]|nr:NfeD family protein [Candidatus Acidoferrales bacterium]
MRTFARYLLFQIPGWAIAAVVLFVAYEAFELSRKLALGLFAAWAAKDFVLYPFVRKAYEADVKTGSQELIGKRGIAKQWLRPEGYVEIHGTLWRATADPETRPISPQTPVRVKDARGLMLIVTAEEPPGEGKT